MIAITQTHVYNFDNAIRGARNPMNSWDRMDSFYNDAGEFVLGENDLSLAVRLRNAGSDDRKFLRQVFLSVDLCAPLYWWKEFDTYKVGTVANSTSTMHKLHSRPFELDDFSHDRLDEEGEAVLLQYIAYLEKLRLIYNETKDKAVWYQIIQLLPSSYNQLRTCTMNYENLINMYYARKSHKLDEWRDYCRWIEGLPYAKELIIGKDKNI